MSAGMQEFFREKYPGLATSVLPHILDAVPRVQKKHEAPCFRDPIRLVFAGNINYSCEEAAGRLLELVRSRPDLTLRIFTGMSPARLEAMGYGGGRIEVLKVPYRDLLARIGESDLVVHPHGFTGRMTAAEYRTIFPTKTLEYLACGRPILAHAPSDSYIARFYRERGCAWVVSEPSVGALSEAVDRLRTDRALRARLVGNALLACRLFRGEDVARRFHSEIAHKLERGPA
jgi:glycosyltransferase involved in cell wall biosynthesis